MVTASATPQEPEPALRGGNNRDSPPKARKRTPKLVRLSFPLTPPSLPKTCKAYLQPSSCRSSPSRVSRTAQPCRPQQGCLALPTSLRSPGRRRSVSVPAPVQHTARPEHSAAPPPDPAHTAFLGSTPLRRPRSSQPPPARPPRARPGPRASASKRAPTPAPGGSPRPPGPCQPRPHRLTPRPAARARVLPPRPLPLRTLGPLLLTRSSQNGGGSFLLGNLRPPPPGPSPLRPPPRPRRAARRSPPAPSPPPPPPPPRSTSAAARCAGAPDVAAGLS
ncbi:formin-like protein 14 [Grammomys surdaster]|uniref:formin-like protein 14 n=1 Tax=Grammomys surdaster TaxID=491861 RepID=UPI00109FA99B|nr:formin-like protein 14 [Grammomys surdaster]